MSESSSSTKSIKQLIRSGGFSKRLNLGRPRIPTPSLSTINSAGSDEEDGNETDIDDGPEDKRKSRTENGSTKVSTKEVSADTSGSKTGEQSFAQRAIFAGMPTLIQNIGSRRSNASAGSNRSSRTSIASSRSSQITLANGLPTITEGPGSPGFAPAHASDGSSFLPSHTPNQQDDSIVPVTQSSHGTINAHARNVSDTPSIASTLAPTPPRNESPMGRKSMTPPPLPQYSSKTSNPSVHSYGTGTDSGSEKTGGKYSSYSPSMVSSRTFNSAGPNPPAYQAQFDEDNIPGSRFSWHRTNQDKAKDWWTRWFIEWWGIELISIGVSALCMVIIMCVLAKYNGKELPAWKIGITINAFISVFAGFAKAALLLPTAEALGQLKWNWFSKKPRTMMDFEVLDSASRGPWGSLVLLARTKGITLASVGAAVILLSLPLDLFYQQIVQYPTVWTVTGVSEISRTVKYDPTLDAYTRLINGSYDTPQTRAPDPSLFAAAYSMFYSEATLQQPDIECNAQRCSWGPFDTLAMCSQCAPVPQAKIQRGCFKTPDNWRALVKWAPYTNSTVDSCGWYITPSEGPPLLVSGYARNSTGDVIEILTGRLLPLRDPVSKLAVVDGATFNFPDVVGPLLNMVMSQTPDGTAGVLRNSTPLIQECVVNWCVKTLMSEIGGSSSQLTERVLNTRVLQADVTTDPWPDPDTFAPSFSLNVSDPQAENGNVSTFFISNDTSSSTLGVFDQLVPSSFVATPDGKKTTFKFAYTVTLARSLGGGLNPWLFPQDPVAHFKKIVDQLSMTMRRQYRSDNVLSKIKGQALDQRVKVHVRWVWIILPSILFILSLLFLTLTMMKSSKDESKIGVWKTSQLAVLFNGLGDDVQNIAPTSTNMGQARKTAKNTMVSLED